MPSSIDSICSSNSLAWVAIGQSSAEGVRSFVVESYVIDYRSDQNLLIARVLHGRRDQAAAWSEPD
jgi:plasmid stabilization system protein ParE